MNTERSLVEQDKALVTLEHKVMDLEGLIASDPYLRSENTRRGYKHDLDKFNEWRQGRAVTELLVEEYAAHLQDEAQSPASINRALSSVRWWARKIVKIVKAERGLKREDRLEIIERLRDVIEVRGVKSDEEAQKGRHIAPGEIKALIDACLADQTPAGVRDGALIALGAATGARRAELAALDVESYNPTGENEADIEISNGKGGKSRAVPVCNGTVDALDDWLLLVRGQDPGPLFCPIRKGGNVQVGDGLTTQALALILEKRAGQAGVENITWHDFRRTVAGELLSLTDMVTVQKILGHKSPRTTARYDRRPHEAMKSAVRGLHIPYTRRGESPAK
jgi:site-specific recombinase XerD